MWDNLGLLELKLKMKTEGTVWEIQEVMGMPIIDDSYCVTLRYEYFQDLMAAWCGSWQDMAHDFAD